MKILGFSQLYNEREKGNLKNWLECMSTCCDPIYIYDQASTDNSQELYKEYNTVVIQSGHNDFSNELVCKSVLLNRLLHDHPDTDWIFWMDGDTLLDGRLLKNNGLKFKELCQTGIDKNLGGFRFEHYNLWRSDVYYRIDDSYHGLSDMIVPLWKNTGNLNFPPKSGLHGNQYPVGLLNKFEPSGYALVHKGFSTDYQIIQKYKIYKERGQEGWELERLLNEDTLEVLELNKELLPEWFTITDDITPLNKKRIREIYNE